MNGHVTFSAATHSGCFYQLAGLHPGGIDFAALAPPPSENDVGRTDMTKFAARFASILMMQFPIGLQYENAEYRFPNSGKCGVCGFYGMKFCAALAFGKTSGPADF